VVQYNDTKHFFHLPETAERVSEGATKVTLAIFDLDNTLLGGDSDYLWGEFLIQRGIVDEESYRRENNRFYEEYKSGTLNIYEFLEFSLAPLARYEMDSLHQMRQQYIIEKIQPIVLPAALELLNRHRQRQHTLMIITATNSFVTEPIAELLGVEHLLATEPEVINNRYSGRVSGTPCFREGKVSRLRQWLSQHGENLQDSWFYSDSHNDLPLLELVSHPAAVDPDETLAWHARQKNWRILSLRNETHSSLDFI
jgi:HAD superfamily hydrolase (TIGR01490 family)